MNLARLALPALLAQWARAVDRFERFAFGAPDRGAMTHDAVSLTADYLEDLAVRHEIALRIRARPVTAETRETLAELDGIFREATEDAAQCVAGESAAAAQGWTAAREWYYWRDLRRPEAAAQIASPP